MRATVPLSFGAEPCQVRPWWNEPPPGLHDDRDEVELSASRRGRARAGEPVVGRVELRARGR